MLIDDDRLERALKKLAQTDAPMAQLVAEVERTEFKAKAMKEAIFLRIDGGSVAERQAKAVTSAEYAEAMDAYFAALQAREAMRNERSKEVIVIECWRSLSSARTKGMI
jgi:hypothetical protein